SSVQPGLSLSHTEQPPGQQPIWLQKWTFDRDCLSGFQIFYTYFLLVESNTTLCNRTVPATHLVGDSSSSVEFFVAVAILAFLYSMVALLVYLGYMHVYRDSDFGPMFDFVLTAVFAFLWLVCSSAWARGLQTVKDATSAAGIESTLALCTDRNVRCEVTDYASMRSLNISVIFGFLNLILWVGNAWFVYKETRWHSQKVNAQQAAGRGPNPAPI
uniref:Synaptophysin like 1 n=1 Tax=Sinocyclocheilus grahami TaxID=75366 RepID=A0A672R8K0_SINGR